MPDAGYDQTLKRLLADAHDGFLALLLPEAHWLQTLATELPPHHREADLVWSVRDHSSEHFLLHLELQSSADARLGERLAEYAIRLYRLHEIPVRSVVVALRPVATIPPSPFTLTRGRGELGFQYAYDVVHLWEIPARRVLEQADVHLWPLVALMADAPAAVVTAAAGIAAADLPYADRAELAGLLAVLTGLQFPRILVEELLRRNAMLHDLIEASSFTAILREEGEAKGRQEGEAKGRQEGEARALQDAVLAILTARFGAVPPDEVAALHTVDPPLLRALPGHVATDSHEQVRAWLGLPPLPPA